MLLKPAGTAICSSSCPFPKRAKLRRWYIGKETWIPKLKPLEWNKWRDGLKRLMSTRTVSSTKPRWTHSSSWLSSHLSRELEEPASKCPRMKWSRDMLPGKDKSWTGKTSSTTWKPEESTWRQRCPLDHQTPLSINIYHILLKAFKIINLNT